MEQKGGGKKVADGGSRDRAFGGGIKDPGVGRAELKEVLAAGSAGLACCGIEVGDRDSAKLDCWTELRDGCGDGGLFGTGGQAVGGVLDVAAGDDLAGGQQEGCAYAKAAVGSVGVLRDLGGSMSEIDDLVC